MNFAMFKVMVLQLWRDRGALVMAFLLPPVVFLIFSAVFAGATGEDVRLKVAIADVAHTAASRQLVSVLVADPQLRAEVSSPASLAEVRRLVRSGAADAGLVIRADPAAKGSPLLILSDPSRAVAAPLTQARVQQALGRAMPDILLARAVDDLGRAIGPLTPDQQMNVSMAQGAVRADAAAGKPVDDSSLFAREDVEGAHKGGGTIAYYAGAVMILFALFSAMNGALTLIDERQTGVADRILAGPQGMGPVINGKFLFLVVQAFLQASTIFLTAQLIYGVPVAANFGMWFATTLAAAACSGGLALGLVALCRSRDQAQMLSTFVILILAAIGGSMVPRFLMPPWLQDIGWLTPHAWVIDAYQGALWRDAGIGELYKAWIILTAVGAIGFFTARLTARRVRR